MAMKMKKETRKSNYAILTALLLVIVWLIMR